MRMPCDDGGEGWMHWSPGALLGTWRGTCEGVHPGTALASAANVRYVPRRPSNRAAKQPVASKKPPSIVRLLV